MSSLVKARLKDSREAIQAKDWSRAYDSASEALENDGENYNALVFKALAASNLKKDGESEELYEKAIVVQPTQQLAWQGLDRLLTERKAWSKLVSFLKRQADAAVQSDEAVRCAECVQRIVSIQHEEGFRAEQIEALSMYLEGFPYHALLSTLPAPDQTTPTATTTFEAQMAIHVDSLKILLDVINLIEASEKDAVEKEVEKRKNRLESMAKPRDQLRNEIGSEVWSSSRLPSLYEQVLSHVGASDEVRRDAEHKLLLYKLNVLKALPNPRSSIAGPGSASASANLTEEADVKIQERKDAMLMEVNMLAEGIVAIDVADEVAWQLVLEWQDCLHLTELDRQRLRAYVHHFPRSGLSRSIEALLYVMKDEQFAIEQATLKKEEADTEDKRRLDPLNLALDGLELAPESLLAHRVVGILYLIDQDWISCSDLVGAALALAKRSEAQLGLRMVNVKTSLESLLAVALTHLHAPQHHVRATRLCDAVLLRDSENVEALLSRANIASTAGKWQQARSTLQMVEEQDAAKSKDSAYQTQRHLSLYKRPGRDARLDMAWCDVQLGRLEQAEQELRQVIDELEAEKDINNLAKPWWRLGQCLWRMDGDRRSDRGNAFSCFITALKHDPAFAPAFTSLAVFYADVAEPADVRRASKCFQKAFELDASEFLAARRLAEMYAEEDDWDLVYLVARRTIEAEGGSWILDVGRARKTTAIAQQRRQLTQNAWAWNAIGSTELLRGNYEQAIVALQVALRSFGDEQHIWMRLGDAYLASGRHSAAIKTYEHAQTLQRPEDRWQSAFCIAQTQVELGMFEDAISVLEQIVNERPELVDIRLTCAQVRLSLARRQARQGFVLRSDDEFCRCIGDVACVLRANRSQTGFAAAAAAAWKVLSDALLEMSKSSQAKDRHSFSRKVAQLLIELNNVNDVDDALPAITSVKASMIGDVESKANADLSLRMLAAFICKARLSQVGREEETAGSSWMDLAIALNEVALTLQRDGEQDQQVGLTRSEAISCAKEALKLEPGNGAYWNTLGSLTASFGVQLAQHCYVKAIECDGKDVTAWNNLGVLYLANEDDDLANECFVRAQTIDPDMVNAWVGQALVASRRGNVRQAASMFRHAFSIDQEGSTEAAYGAASCTLQQLQLLTGARDKPNAGHLRTCASALALYLTFSPDDVAALHLSALIAEQICGTNDRRDGMDDNSAQWFAAAEQIEMAAERLEADYEDKETPITAQRFAVCMANLGRIYVSSGRFDEAVAKFELCLGLLEDGGEEQDRREDLPLKDLQKAKMGAHCGLALAHVGLGAYDEAIDALTLALNESGDDGLDDVKAKEVQTVLLAQVLVQSGDSKEARDVLQEHAASHPSSLASRTVLTALAWLEKDEEQVAKLQMELQALSNQEEEKQSDVRKAVQLLALIDTYEGRIDDGLRRLHHLGRQSAEARVQLCEAAVRHAVLRGPNDREACQMAGQTSENVYRSLLTARDADVSLALLVRSMQLRTVALALQSKADEKAMDGDECAIDNVAPPSLCAVHAVVQSPNEEQNWQLLEAVCNM